VIRVEIQRQSGGVGKTTVDAAAQQRLWIDGVQTATALISQFAR